MPAIQFEPTILVFEWEMIFSALDRAATVTGEYDASFNKISLFGQNCDRLFSKLVWVPALRLYLCYHKNLYLKSREE
jgi:hypothetical protein